MTVFLREMRDTIQTMMYVTREMKEKYLIRRQEEILLLLGEALLRGHIEVFHRSGHKLLGSAESFGFPELMVFGLEMERLSVKDFATQAQQLIEDFTKCVEILSKKIE
jgi:HPt (histidine-containing phosphotransfer) domain-containing protein